MKSFFDNRIVEIISGITMFPVAWIVVLIVVLGERDFNRSFVNMLKSVYSDINKMILKGF